MANGDELYNAFDTANIAIGSKTGSSDVPQTATPSIPDTMAVSQASRDSESQKKKSTDDVGLICRRARKSNAGFPEKPRGSRLLLKHVNNWSYSTTFSSRTNAYSLSLMALENFITAASFLLPL